MSRDRDDDRDDLPPRNDLPPRDGRRRLLGDRWEDPAPFDPAEFDTPADPPLTPARIAQGQADEAQAHSFFSHLSGDVQRILAGMGGFRELVADIRARLADAAAREAKRAEAEAERDKLIASRLIDPERLGAYAAAGAKQGVTEAIGVTAQDLKRQLTADAAARDLVLKQMAFDQAERRADELRRRKRDTIRNWAILAVAVLIPAGFIYGYHLGENTGTAASYARSRDEVAAASWANTPNGKIARQIDQASQQTLPDIANCPEENGWETIKQHGRVYCYGSGAKAKKTTGWIIP